MTFAGLPLSVVLGVGALAAALTVAFYVLKLRRRPVPVPFSPLWRRVLKDEEASRWFARLRRLLSLLLQLALLGLLLVALLDPRQGRADSNARHVVVLVDASASMQAIDGAPTRLDSARTAVRGLIEGLGGADRMLVAQMDVTTTPLSTMTSDAAELSAAVYQVRPTDTRADLRRGLELALDVLRGTSRPNIVVVSDGALPDRDAATEGLDLAGVELSHVAVGSRTDNVAITAFSARRYPLDKSRYEVLLEVENTGTADEPIELTLRGDGAVIDVSKLTIARGERLTRVYENLGGASRRLEAGLRYATGKRDALPADDRAFALMPERRRARVLVVSGGSTYLEAALLLDEYLDVTVVSPDAYPPESAFDVTVFDGVAPPRVPRTGAAFYLGAPEGGPVSRDRALEDFGFDTWDRKSPLLRWIAPDNIQVARGFSLTPMRGDSVVGASDAGATLVRGVRPEGAFVALGFDPRDSDIVLRVAWPLLVLNVIDGFVQESAEYLSSYRTGDLWRVPVLGGFDEATLTSPDTRTSQVVIRDGRVTLLGDRAGFYSLSMGSGSVVAEVAFAANLSDVAESRIAPAPNLELGGRKTAAPVGFEPGLRREIWAILLAVALGLSLLEWTTYHRRATV